MSRRLVNALDLVEERTVSRARFEKHILRETPEAHMNRNAFGDYECPGVQREWRTWQEALQALQRAAA